MTHNQARRYQRDQTCESEVVWVKGVSMTEQLKQERDRLFGGGKKVYSKAEENEKRKKQHKDHRKSVKHKMTVIDDDAEYTILEAAIYLHVSTVTMGMMVLRKEIPCRLNENYKRGKGQRKHSIKGKDLREYKESRGAS